MAPLERLKILMQVQGNQKIYTGVWQGLKHMARTEGIRGMMKGNLANCIRIVPNSAVKFLTYEQLSRCARGALARPPSTSTVARGLLRPTAWQCQLTGVDSTPSSDPDRNPDLNANLKAKIDTGSRPDVHANPFLQATNHLRTRVPGTSRTRRWIRAATGA